MTHLKHARTADRLSKVIAALEAEREGIADTVRNDKGGARDKVLAELANAAHELEQAFRSMR
jgi:HPt (histidine-containing phosphotransfer) domain-containing protein